MHPPPSPRRFERPTPVSAIPAESPGASKRKPKPPRVGVSRLRRATGYGTISSGTRPTETFARLDQKRKGKKIGNDEWYHPHNPDAVGVGRDDRLADVSRAPLLPEAESAAG